MPSYVGVHTYVLLDCPHQNEREGIFEEREKLWENLEEGRGSSSPSVGKLLDLAASLG